MVGSKSIVLSNTRILFDLSPSRDNVRLLTLANQGVILFILLVDRYRPLLTADWRSCNDYLQEGVSSITLCGATFDQRINASAYSNIVTRSTKAS